VVQAPDIRSESVHSHPEYNVPCSFPAGRIGLATLLADAGISRNTFFLRYRRKKLLSLLSQYSVRLPIP
jgi:hypothetical protein